MLIRPVTQSDIPSVARIHIASWQAAYQGIVPASFLNSMDVVERTERWLSRYDKIADSMFVAEVDGEIQAWVLCGRSREVDDPVTTGEVYAIYADPASWGKGLGTALLARVELTLRDQGYTDVFLLVLAENTPTRLFYEARGYQATATTKLITIAGSALTEIRYERRL